MSDLWISQDEADRLISTPKRRADDSNHLFPPADRQYKIEIVSVDGRETFILDMSCSSKVVQELKLQKRSRGNIVLVRLDISGAPHRNPDGVEYPCPHIHTYKEGYGDSWASPIDSSIFSNTEDHWITIHEFFRFCNIDPPPNLIKSLF